MTHRGPAMVFESPEEYYAVADDPDMPVDENTVLVIRNCGPRGYPGMPEVSNVPCRRNCSNAGSPTWCGSATAACPAPPTARSSCTSLRRRRSRPAGPRRTGDTISWTYPPGRSPWRSTTRSWPAAGRLEGARPARGPRLGTPLRRARPAGRPGVDLDFLVGASGHDVPRESH